MDEFVKKLKIQVDDKDIQKLRSTLDDLGQGNFKNIGKDIGASFGVIGAAVGEAVGAALSKFIDMLKDALEEIKEMYRYERLSQSDVRNLRFQYGFSGGQAYGFDLAKQLLGIQSEEDLYWLNPQEKKLFLDAFTKYTDKYNKLLDSGFFEKQLEFQVEWQMFKQDFLLELAQFLINNKDTIMAVMNALLWIAKGIINMTQWVVDTADAIIDFPKNVMNFLSGNPVSSNTINKAVHQNITITGTGISTQELAQEILQSTMAAFK